MPDLSAEEIARTDFGTYSENQFLDEMAREYARGPGESSSMTSTRP
jgi:hypothetical protein